MTGPGGSSLMGPPADADGPELPELSAWQLDYRVEALRCTVALYARREQNDQREYDARREHDYFIGDVVRTYGVFLGLLTARPVTLTVGDPVIAEQGHPARTIPLTRKGLRRHRRRQDRKR